MIPPAIISRRYVSPVKLAVKVYSSEGYGIVPRVPISLAPGPQTLSKAEIEPWSRRVRVMLEEPEPQSASRK